MSALSWWEFAGCVLAGCGLAGAILAVVLPLVPSGDRAEAEAVQDAPDFAEHVTTAGVPDGDSRVMARWCDQTTVDQLFLGMVDTPAMQAIDRIDKES